MASPSRAGQIAGLMVLLGLSIAYAGPPPITFTTIADQDTINPGGTPPGQPQGTLMSMGDAVLYDGEVSFRASVRLSAISSTDGGYFRGDGGSVILLADVFTAAPGATGNFRSINHPALDGPALYVSGQDETGMQQLYQMDPGDITNELDNAVPVPGGTNNFTGYNAKSADRGRVAFIGFEATTFNIGVYLYDGLAVQMIADENTALPDDPIQNFQYFAPDQIANAGDQVAFYHADTDQEQPIGLYLFDGAQLQFVADFDTPVPGGMGNFTAFGDMDFDGQRIVFTGDDGAGDPGLYQFASGTLSVLVDANTNPPPGLASLGGFRGIDLSGGDLSYIARESGGGGRGIQPPSSLFVQTHAGLVTVVSSGDIVDGEEILELDAGRDTLHRDQVVFSARMVDPNFETEGIYLATFPNELIFSDGYE